MTEDQNSNQLDGTSTVIRQNLVDTAVNFLLNVDVISRPEKSKTAFLKTKGLNDVEILMALDKAKADPKYFAISNPNFTVAPPLPYPQKTYSFWTQLGRISSSFIAIAVALYGLNHFYKLYIEPWLYGKKSEKSQIRLMEEQLLELNNSVVQLSATVSTLEKSVNSHKEQIDGMIEASGLVSASVAVSSLKTEIGNVKSLLINRHQFPAVPKVVSPSIPHWQLQSDDNENSETEQISKEEGEPENDLSMKIECKTESISKEGNEPENDLCMKTECDQLSGNLPFVQTSEKNGIENGIADASLDNETSSHKNESQHNDPEKV